MKILASIILLASLAFPVSAGSKPDALWIKLNSDKDLITLKGRVDESTRDDFIEKIMTSNNSHLYIYIDSPGGSVFHMNEMIEHMLFSGKRFTCIARYAVSAAFSILQFCDKRYMMPYSAITMSHNASGGMYGTLPQMKSNLKMWDDIVKNIEKQIAKRLGMPYKKYKYLIANDLWLNFKLAVKYKAIDGPGFITCSKKLTEKKIKKTKKVCSFFGGCNEIEEIVSACPILNKTYKKKEKK